MIVDDVDTSTATLPSRYNAAKTALAQCTQVDECKDWADKASALASYAKQAKDKQLLNYAQRIKNRAMKRAGELLKQVEPGNTQDRGGGRNIMDGTVPDVSRRRAAEEAGLSERQAKTAQRLANVPEEEFEQMNEAGATMTEIAEAGIQKREVDDRAAKAEAKKLVDRMSNFAKGMDEYDMDLAVGAMTNGQRQRAKMLIQKIDGLMDALSGKVL